MIGLAEADALPTNMTLEQTSMAQAIMVRNVLHNVTTPSQLLNMTLPLVATKSDITATPVGRVVWVKGEFTGKIKNGDVSDERSLDKTSVIYLHDLLETGNESSAQIVFTDNTLMTFKPETKFYVDQYAFHADSKNKSVGKYVMNLIEGGFRTITGLIAKSNPSDYQVNTPVATIGVRGTDYTIVLKGTGLYLGRNKGEPCVKSEMKNLCLDQKNKYASVASAGAEPTYISQPPAFMMEPIRIVPVTVTEVSSAPLSTSVTTSPQPVIGGSAGSGASDFCIR